MRIVSLLEKNHSIYKKNKCIVNATFVAKELCENPSKNLYHKVTLALSVLEGVLEEYPRNSSVKSDSNVRSYAKNFVDFIYQNVGDNRNLVKYGKVVEFCKKRSCEQNISNVKKSMSDVKNILIGAGIIEYTESKDRCFVSIKNKDKFEKLRDSLDSKTSKNIVIKKKKSARSK